MLEAATATLGLAVLGIFGWAFQVSNRVSVLETRYEDLVVLINEKFDGLDPKFTAVTDRLSRIERGMNGHLGK